MKTTGIFYGSTTGTTAGVARRIAKALGVDEKDVHDVASTMPSALGNYDVLILGSSTWGSGDLQEDWYDFLDGAEQLDLKDKKIALFGCGDETMSDTFDGAVGEIYHRMGKTGASFIAPFNAEGYTFRYSPARVGDTDTYVGLLLDEVNHPELTDARIAEWAEVVKAQE